MCENTSGDINGVALQARALSAEQVWAQYQLCLNGSDGPTVQIQDDVGPLPHDDDV